MWRSSHVIATRTSVLQSTSRLQSVAFLQLGTTRRSCATTTTTSTPPQTTPAAAAAATVNIDEAAAVKPKRRFTSSPKFKLKDSEVNENNIPSAAEIKEMLPTREELLEQLPTKTEIDSMYGLRNKGAGSAPPLPEWLQKQKRGESSAGEGDAAVKNGIVGRVVGFFSFFKDDQQAYVTKALQDAADREAAEKAAGGNGTGADGAKKPHLLHDEPLWPDCDTVDDILKEESFSGAEEGDAAEKQEGAGGDTGEYLLLACKALLYGSVMAVLLVSVMSVLVSYFYFGFTSLADMFAFMALRQEREMAALRQKALEESAKSGEEGDVEIHQYKIDLTNPTELWDQLTGLMQLLEELAEQQAKEEEEALLQPIVDSTSSPYSGTNATNPAPTSTPKPAKKAFVLP